MASTIQIKRGTGSAVPSGLADGELAINLDNGKLYFGSGSTSVNSFTFTNLTAENYIVSSSVLHITTSFSSGSTIFGDTADDTHQFTGNVTASGNISASGKIFANRFGNNLEIIDNSNVTTIAVDSAAGVNNSGLKINVDGVDRIDFQKGVLPTKFNTNTLFDAPITASGNISASGTITANAGVITTLTSTNVTASSITSSGTITANEAVLGTALAVSSGGTGATSLTSNAILTGNGTSAVQAESNLSFSSNTLTIGSDDANSATIQRKQHGDNSGGALVIRAGDGTGTNEDGGILRFHGGRGTGAGTPGEIRFSVSSPGSSGTSQQTDPLTRILTLTNTHATVIGKFLATGDANFTSHITASGNISSSGTITSNAGVITTLTSTNVTASSITSSGTITANAAVLTTADINGGTIDGITSLTAGGDLDIGAHNFRAATLQSDGLSTGHVIIAGNQGVLTGDSSFIFDASTDNVGIGPNITSPGEKLTVSGNISASGTITGNAGVITTLTSTNVTASSITSSGTITANSLVGPLATAAQTNITSVGTLGSLTVSGDITANGDIVGDDGTNITNISSIECDSLIHDGDTDTKLTFGTDAIRFTAGNNIVIDLDSDSILINKPITASGNISSSGTIFANTYEINGKKVLTGGDDDTGTLFQDISSTGSIFLGKPNLTPSIFANGAITCSTDISSSGTISGVLVGGDTGIITTLTSTNVTASSITSSGTITANAGVITTLTSTNVTASSITSSGTVTANSLRLTSTTDASATSTGHAFQTGLTSGVNIIIDNNEIMARNNGSEANLHLNADGGDVFFHNNVADSNTIISATNGITTSGHITASGNISASGDIIANETYLDNGGSVYFGLGTSNEIRLRGVSGELLILSSSDVGIKINPGAGHITASGDITSSGTITANAGVITTLTSTNVTASSITSSGTITGNSIVGNTMVVEADDQAQILISTLNSATNRDVGLNLSASSNGQQYSLALDRPNDAFVIAPSNVHDAPGNAVFALDSTGNITASGDISSSGTVTSNAGVITTLTSTNVTASSITSSGTVTANAGVITTLTSTNVTASSITSSGIINCKLGTTDSNTDAAHYAVLQTAANTEPLISNAFSVNPSTNIVSLNIAHIARNKFAISTTSAGNSNSSDVVYIGGGSTTTGKVHYYKSDGEWGLTDADAASTATGWLAVALGTDPDVDGMVIRGMVTLAGDIVGTEALGSILYLDTATTGDVTTVAPSGTNDIVRVVGYAVSTGNDNQIWFDPSTDWVEHA